MMNTGKRDYYADLGLSSSAKPEEIKTVYRALVRIYHPDVNSDKAASATFRKITEAYDVLSDPKKRKDYDESTVELVEPKPSKHTQSEPVTTVEPVSCSVCNKVVAQPRYLLFRSVVSILFMTTRTPKHGVYCVECARKTSLRTSLTSALFGWWGVPWGPIFTIKEVLSNATGGERQIEIEENLIWQNTVAFLHQEKYELAGSFAALLSSSKNPEIAAAANRTLGVLRAQDIPIKKLKNVWRFDISNFLKHLFLLCLVPSIIAFLVVGPFSFANSQYKATFPKNTKNLPNLQSKKEPPIATTIEKLSPPKLVDLCKNRPRNGKIFGFSFIPEKDGHRLTINNGAAGDAIVKLRKAETRELVASFFVEKNMSASLDGISDGIYRVQFAFGDEMKANCSSFITPSASEFEGTQEFFTRRTETEFITRELTFTLFTVINGNAKQSQLSPLDFEND